MDYRPVGIFDSGMGGLTAVRVLREMLPGEDIAYLGDTARVPYGGRSVEELRRIAESDARFLRAREIKAMLVACGTVSSNCLGEVEATAGVPVIGVVKPAAAEAAAATKNGKIGVLSTVATMRSGAFVRELLRLSPELEVTSSGSPLLVPLVEAGRADPEDAEVASAVEEKPSRGARRGGGYPHPGLHPLSPALGGDSRLHGRGRDAHRLRGRRRARPGTAA
ncbi:MAG: glutamate racemase [Lachnospiraceae bacterium]